VPVALNSAHKPADFTARGAVGNATKGPLNECPGRHASFVV
jgi:hypothetical protein